MQASGQRFGWVSPFTIALGLLLAAPCAVQLAAAAPIDDLDKMVQNLGYATTRTGSNIVIKITGKSEYSVGMAYNDDGSQLFGYIKMYEIPDDKLAKIPTIDVLSFNDDNVDYLSVHKTGANWFTVINFQRAAAAVTPQVLRVAIEQIVKDADGTTNLTDPSTWK